MENKLYTTILIKRRVAGNPGPPDFLNVGELAFNETNQTLYIGSNIQSLSAAEEF